MINIDKRVLNFALGLVAFCAVIVVLVKFVDIPVADYVHANTTQTSEDIGRVLDEAGKSHWILGALVVIAASFFIKKPEVSKKAWLVFSSIAATGLVANLIKILVCRSRPPLLFSHGVYTAHPFAFEMDYLWNSFPSGHATTGIALAVSLSYVAPKYRSVAWVVGLFIAMGRVLYNVHYVSDVVAGCVVGIVVTLGVIQLSKKWMPTQST